MIKTYTFLALLIGSFAVAAQQTAFINNPPIAITEDFKTGSLQGTITTTDAQPAAGVSILLKGTNRGTVTDDNGFFVLKGVKEGSYVIEVSMTGLQTVQKQVQVKKDETTSLQLSLAENASELKEVVVRSQRSQNKKPVTIGKVPIDPMDLPQSIAVVGPEVLRQQQVQRLSDVIKNVNGVYLGTARASTQENFYARGYSFSSTNLFKNGARVNSGAMPEMSSLDKVEVLKGSAAILYGQVAPGGVVNMVTKQPKFRFGGEVAFRAGSYDLYKPSFDVYGPLNDNIAFRVNGTYETAQSFRDVVGSERQYINPSLLFKLGNRTELLVEGDYLKHHFTPDFGIGSLDNTKIPDVTRSRFYGATWQYATTAQSTATATIKHLLNEAWTVNAIVSYQNYNRDYYSTERIQADAEGQWKRPLGRTFTAEDYYTGQVNLTGKFKTGAMEHTLLAGADAEKYFTSNHAFNQPAIYDTINILDLSKYEQRTDVPAADKIRIVDIPSNRFGAYVQDLVKLSPKLNVLAGLRWSYLETLGADTTNLLNGKQTKGATKKDAAFSPRLGLVYKPTETTSVFLSYANSFIINSGIDVDGNVLKPSIVDQYEAGVKNDFFNGLLSANVTVYRIINNNLAQTAPFLKDGVTPNNNTAIKALTGQTTSDGIEIDLSGQPTAGLNILAGYSYNYMRYTQTPDAKGNFIEGERLVNTPAHTANASVFYTFYSSKLKGLKLGASANYVGDRFGGWNNTKMQVQNYSRLIPVDAFTTIDISAGYSFKKISLLAKVSNLTNTYNYYMHENYSINPIAPRQVIGTVAYKF
ncbi:MAG: TonB-dependent siderophore receptor [Chitinophagaceae bacterium]